MKVVLIEVNRTGEIIEEQLISTLDQLFSESMTTVEMTQDEGWTIAQAYNEGGLVPLPTEDELFLFGDGMGEVLKIRVHIRHATHRPAN